VILDETQQTYRMDNRSTIHLNNSTERKKLPAVMEPKNSSFLQDLSAHEPLD
jgi:hypothetical protein